ncbi:hypothetical protein LTR53_008354 [Teratosphaeriaceae sp. CCFEE 6253]|nr:hypothetical protein LTR53_008354 [Teratosphaeriaceae sp. CCFEE 6253]
MIAFMNAVTDKPGWQYEVLDGDVVDEWRKELAVEVHEDRRRELADPECRSSRRLDSSFSGKMFIYCLNELADYATLCREQGFVPALDATATVYKADTMLDAEVIASLQAAVEMLENDPTADPNLYTGPRRMVLNLVNPSMFPLMYGRTRIFPDGGVPLHDCIMYSGKGRVMPDPLDEHEFEDQLDASEEACALISHLEGFRLEYSSQFQWLPTEVALRANGSVKIVSYINNLHPEKHKDLYKIVEKAIAKAIPMFNATLSPCATRTHLAGSRVLILETAEWSLSPGNYQDRKHSPPTDRVRTDPALVKSMGIPARPSQPTSFESGVVDLLRDFRGQNLQVVVKLSNICLTPQTPIYDRGKWRIEGQLNDHICACALYYYDCENIANARLAFRESMDRDKLRTLRQQFDWEPLLELYDVERHGTASQELGEVLVKEGRLVVFPNVLQHSTPPFYLKDGSKPGHCKVLELLLVDPNTRIPSTSHVPPQRKDWWSDMVLSLDRIAKLPPELAQHVLDSTDDFPIEYDEGRASRLGLTVEHSAFNQVVDAKMTREGFTDMESDCSEGSDW